MKLGTVLEAAASRVSGGSEFQWECYPDARYVDIADIDDTEICNILHSTKTQDVYEVQVFVNEDDLAYRWVNPDFADLYIAEAMDRNIDPHIAYDDVVFTEIIDDEKILELVHKIVHKTYVHEKPHVDRTFDIDTPPDATFPEDEHSSHCGYAGHSEQEELEYEVGINVAHILSVKATSMEEAVCKAKKFTKAMRPSDYPDGLSWIDSYVAKERVSRDLAVEHIEE